MATAVGAVRHSEEAELIAQKYLICTKEKLHTHKKRHTDAVFCVVLLLGRRNGKREDGVEVLARSFL